MVRSRRLAVARERAERSVVRERAERSVVRERAERSVVRERAERSVVRERPERSVVRVPVLRGPAGGRWSAAWFPVLPVVAGGALARPVPVAAQVPEPEGAVPVVPG
ncbi:hypothetical protein [Sanguibacter sp. Z1732]|uniref:hypothetical protein n=1 Tax=Sanguibacter sp. Z1732 TaxID=3435412 RepID=UPI003D9C980E